MNEGKNVTDATDLRKQGLPTRNKISPVMDFLSDGGVPEQAELDPVYDFSRTMGEMEREVGVYHLSVVWLICI